MNKTEFVKATAAKAGMTIKDADAFYDAAIQTIVEEVAKGEKLVLPGFGSFEGRKRPAKTGINPKTKEKIEIKASTSPVFKAGKGFKDAVNK